LYEQTVSSFVVKAIDQTKILLEISVDKVVDL